MQESRLKTGFSYASQLSADDVDADQELSRDIITPRHSFIAYFTDSEYHNPRQNGAPDAEYEIDSKSKDR